MGRDFSRSKYVAYKKAGESFVASNPWSKFKKNKISNIDESKERLEDPQSLSDVFKNVVEQRDWKQSLSEGNFLNQWQNVVGEEIASHAIPLTLDEGVLTLQASSTAWATQLNLISSDLLRTIQATSSGVLVHSIKVLPPKSPSWKKGLRSIKGAHGPRDTYG
jgi:predicted nucleic acid-binding Zn ribbon protein